jgi:hypothetical protein
VRAFLILALAGNAFAQVDEPSPSPSPEVSPSPSPLPSPLPSPSPEAVAPAPLVEVKPVAPRFVPNAVTESRTFTWPWTLDVHVLVGAELHTVGQPIAFGLGAEALYHGWLGMFVSLLGSEGTPILVGGTQSLADRVSVPFGFAVRPAGREAQHHTSYGWRLLGGIGLQAGISIELLRVSDNGVTTAGLHLQASIDVPLYGGPTTGGLALRAGARLIVTPEETFDQMVQGGKVVAAVHEPIASGQIFVGIAYVP